MNVNSAVENVARAEDLQNLLDHIAWTETLKPALLKAKATFEGQLVQATLGNAPTDAHGQVVTVAQLAGRAYGLAFVVELVEDILRRGGRSLDALKSFGVNITAPGS
jgi:hypothetical protein